MPDIKLDTTTHLHPDDITGPDPHAAAAGGDEDGDATPEAAERDGPDPVGLPAAGLARQFGNEVEREHPD